MNWASNLWRIDSVSAQTSRNLTSESCARLGRLRSEKKVVLLCKLPTYDRYPDFDASENKIPPGVVVGESELRRVLTASALKPMLLHRQLLAALSLTGAHHCEMFTTVKPQRASLGRHHGARQPAQPG